ncbi:MAG: DUF1800 family protein [Verrucomicrobiia bacterium]
MSRWRWIAVLALLASPVVGGAQMVDLNGNGMSDIWEWIYGAYGLNPNADSDGDGLSNLQEATAGTNPFDSNSVPRISPVVISGTNLNLVMPGALGKLYQLQSVTNLGSTNWLVETGLVLRAGTNFTLPFPVLSTTKYFRIAISDVDSDGDGLNDWEEYQLGLDPSNAFSNATLDGNGNPLNDYQYVVGKLASQNVITIAATDPVTTQPDPGQSPTDLGAFTVTRGGFPLNAITVNLGPGGPGVGFATAGLDYSNNLPASVTLPAGANTKSITVTPLANTNLPAPVIAQLKLLAGVGYTVGSPGSASVVIYPSSTAKGTGLMGYYFTNASLTYASTTNFNPTNLFQAQVDPAIDFTWTNGTSPDLSNGVYTVRWTGQVQPQYSELYTFDTVSDDGVRLWVNDQLLIDKWQSQSGTEWTNSILLQGGTRYDLKLEYLQYGGKAQAHLYWYSADQSRQIIPSRCLYPTNLLSGGSNAPAAVTSPLSAVGFLGQPFSFTVTGANTPLGYTANGLPPGLAINSTNGLISGTPSLAGDYQVMLTTSNAVGVGASVVDILILNTGSSVVQEIWTGVPGTNITDIPTGTPANIVNAFGALEGITDYGDNYGERIRGYFTAPATGNYYFWIAGSDSAQLWISDDTEPVNKVLRAWVTPTNNPAPPPQNGTAPRQWNVQSSQQSKWLTLVAGQKYYLEILHKAGVGAGDNWSVAWLQDPTGTNRAPAGIVPSYLLSRYYPPLPANIPGTLYSANMLALPGVTSDAVGSATLRVSADGTQATLNLSINNLAGTASGESINSDPYLGNPSQLLFDISGSKPQSDGSYLWKIKPTGTLTNVADILELVNEGKAFVNIESSIYPNGEISGHLTLANGTQTFTPPPSPPSWTDDSADPNAAARFLTQATFGPSSNDIATVQSLGYAGWINYQLGLPATHHLPVVLANASADPTDPYPSTDWFNTWWQQSVTAPDQLRQRVALALSEIMVVSENGVLQNNATALAAYYDTLLDNAFGNYRSLLKAVTLTPAMGLYLNMQGNDKGSIITGIHANENYAREIQQLFSIGLNRLWLDGTLILNSSGTLVPTYNQNVVSGFAATFTGWNYYQTNQANGRLPANFYPPANDTNALVLVPTHHDLGAKLLLDNVMLPPAWGNQANSAFTNFDLYGSSDLESALDSIFYNQNVGPFICRQLIQRLVTSNPSRDYVYRVAQVFNDNGSGMRGDLSAVISAILLDYEARGASLVAQPTYGKQREPLLRVTATARAFPSPPTMNGTYSESGTQTNTITTAAPHRLNNGDTVQLRFTDTSGSPAPPNQPYTATAIGANTFTVNAPNLSSGAYAQSNNVITVNVSSHGLLPGNAAYLVFTSGGAANGLYQVSTTNSTSSFTVATPDAATRAGNCLLPKISASGFTQTGTNITIDCSGPHGLITNESLYINFTTLSPAAGQYQVAGIPDASHFTLTVTTSSNQTQSSFSLYPLAPPVLIRSGNVVVQWSTWNFGYTDAGSSSSLSQSPLRAPTVFNFYYPSYEFPGALASAGLTTPEFQLTSDTSVALQMNFLEGGILNNAGNTNGLSSFTGGNGSLVLDIGPWMTPNYTADTGVPNLVDGLNTLLLAGQLSAAAKTNIIAYVANTNNFSYTTPIPTQTQMRDRVRAVVHLIVNSPDFTIQK